MKILILGGGISGLSTAWYCRRKHPEAKITLLEKSNRLGGWIQTRRDGGFLFEEGPRTFPFLRSPHLRELIQEVGLEKEIIVSNPKSNKKYLWHQGKLRSISSFLPRFLPALIWGKLKKDPQEDLSIYEFAKQKYGLKIAETLFDPITLGIYGGDIRKLSFSSCFPQWIQQKGFFFPRSGGLFALKGGMDRLIEALQKQLNIEIITDCKVDELHPQGAIAMGSFWKADKIFSALPADVLGRLSGLWTDFPMLSLWRVFLAYPQSILPKKGFGYLIPTQEKESVMGMIWDSEVFPEQNLSTETRITAMIREGVQDPVREALLAIKKHLGVGEKPIYAAQVRAENGIPQFEVGYQARLSRWREEMSFRFPRVIPVGNYLEGPSVEACIRSAKMAVS